MSGPNDSSKTRVQPVFDELFRQDKTGIKWVSRLVGLPTCPGNVMTPSVPPAPLTRWGWGDAEIPLAAPLSLLQWLVSNAVLNNKPAHLKTSALTQRKRNLLLKSDPATIVEAQRLLRQCDPLSGRLRKWYVLEGNTQPDVYLESEKFIVVIEGKRTESRPTVGTTWMPIRHQMLRHLDAAWEYRNGRDVMGFFIVEEGGEFDLHAAVAATIRMDNLEKSLPHRRAVEREAISRCFLGGTTWQQVYHKFNIRLQ